MSEGLDCSICFNQYDFKDLFFADACGHMFCNGCMEDTVKSNIKHGETSVKCPSANCPYDLGYYEIKHLLRNDKESIEKYERFLYEKSIEEMDDVVWCPIGHCNSPVPINPGTSKAKCLNCNFKFCIKCRDELHENTCEWNKKWKGKIDSFDAWKDAYGDKLKVCPGCENLCEKISGCSTVPCVKCKTVFCWLCCAKIEPNTNHFNVPKGCLNTYKPEEKKTADPPQPTYELPEEDSNEESEDDLPQPRYELKSEDSGNEEASSPMAKTSFSNNNDNNDDESLEESPVLDRYIPSNNFVMIGEVYSPFKIIKPKQPSFSKDDYIDDDDFDEVLKRLNKDSNDSNDSNDKTSFMSVKSNDNHSYNDDSY